MLSAYSRLWRALFRSTVVMASDGDGNVEDMRVPNRRPVNLYELCVFDISGKHVCLEKYRGKVLLIVNVATQAASASNTYRELNELYEKYHEEGLELLAFPCNQFGSQEPDTCERIQEKTSTRFLARFPVFEKIDVNGPKESPLYKYLKDVKSNGEPIRWNFTKFLVNRTGGIAERYPPSVLPHKLEEDIKSLLAVELDLSADHDHGLERADKIHEFSLGLQP